MMGSYATKIIPTRAANSDMPLRVLRGASINLLGQTPVETPDIAVPAVHS